MKVILKYTQKQDSDYLKIEEWKDDYLERTTWMREKINSPALSH